MHSMVFTGSTVLYINACDLKVLGIEVEPIANFASLVKTEHPDVRIILAEFYRTVCVDCVIDHRLCIPYAKSPGWTLATVPRTGEAMALQVSPTKSLTETILAASLADLSWKSKCLEGGRSCGFHYIVSPSRSLASCMTAVVRYEHDLMSRPR